MTRTRAYILTLLLGLIMPSLANAQDSDDILKEYGVYDIVQQYADPTDDYDLNTQDYDYNYPSQNTQNYYPQPSYPQNNYGYDTPKQTTPTYPTQNKQVNPTQNKQVYPAQNNTGYPTQNKQVYPTQNKQVYPTQNNTGYPSRTTQTPTTGQGNYQQPAPKTQPSYPTTQNRGSQSPSSNSYYVPTSDADIDALLNDAYQLIDDVQPNQYNYPQYEQGITHPKPTPQNAPSTPSNVIPKQTPAINSPTPIKQTPTQQPAQNINPTKTVTTPTPVKQTPIQQPAQNVNPTKTVTTPVPTTTSYNTSSASYRSLLSSYEQKLYDPIYSAIAEGRVSVSVNGDLGSAIVKRVIEAIANDHPELFWMSEGFSQSQTLDGQQVTNTKVIFDYNQLVNNAQAVQAFATASAQVVSKARAAGSPLEMEKYIHDYLVSSVTYGQNSLDQSAYAAIVNKHCVCAGYARAFKHFMNQLGIPCYVVTGMQTDSDGSTESHAWNLVYINGKCYNVDVTSDSVEVHNGRSTQTQIDYRLFNKSDSEFKKMGYTRESEYSSTAFHLPTCN